MRDLSSERLRSRIAARMLPRLTEKKLVFFFVVFALLILSLVSQ